MSNKPQVDRRTACAALATAGRASPSPGRSPPHRHRNAPCPSSTTPTSTRPTAPSTRTGPSRPTMSWPRTTATRSTTSSPKFFVSDFNLKHFTEVGLGGVLWIADKPGRYSSIEVFLLPDQMIPEHWHVARPDDDVVREDGVVVCPLRLDVCLRRGPGHREAEREGPPVQAKFVTVWHETPSVPAKSPASSGPPRSTGSRRGARAASSPRSRTTTTALPSDLPTRSWSSEPQLEKLCQTIKERRTVVRLSFAFPRRPASMRRGAISSLRHDHHRLIQRRRRGRKRSVLAPERSFDVILEVGLHGLGRQRRPVDAAGDVLKRHFGELARAQRPPGVKLPSLAPVGVPDTITVSFSGSPAMRPCGPTGTNSRAWAGVCAWGHRVGRQRLAQDLGQFFAGRVESIGMMCCCQLVTLPISPGVLTVASR